MVKTGLMWGNRRTNKVREQHRLIFTGSIHRRRTRRRQSQEVECDNKTHEDDFCKNTTGNIKPETQNHDEVNQTCLYLILWLTTEQMIPFDSQEARLLSYRLEILHVSLKVLTCHAQV